MGVAIASGPVHGWDGLWMRRGPLELGLVPRRPRHEHVLAGRGAEQLRGPGVAWIPRRERGSIHPDGVKAYPAEGDSEAARPHVVRTLGDVARIDCRRPGCFKFGVDAGEGWVLGIVESESSRLVAHRKCVAVVAGATYAHGSVVEVYNSPDHLYFELEMHGPLVDLRPGERTMLVERRRVGDVAAWPETADEVRALATR